MLLKSLTSFLNIVAFVIIESIYTVAYNASELQGGCSV